MTKQIAIISLITAIGLVGCNSAVSNETKEKQTPQDNVCVVSALAGVKDLCKPGEIVYFEPNNWGNEQLPTMFIALACDTNKPVYFTTGGVVCTFVDRKSVNGKLIGGNNSKESSTSRSDSK